MRMLFHMRYVLVTAVLSSFVLISASSTRELAYAQQPAAQKLYLSIDYASYRGDGTLGFVEIYYSFGVDHLTLITAEGNLSVLANLHVRFSDPESDSVILQRSWQIPYTLKDSSELGSSKGLVGVLGFWLRPGRYKVQVIGLDAHRESNRDSIEFPLVLKSFPADSLALSDLELCSSIRQIDPDSTNIFYKNTLEVVPNPSVLYGSGLPMVFYYIEVYNLLKKAKDGEYTFTASVQSTSGERVLQQRRKKRRVHDSSVEVGAMNVSQLPSGTYTFVFTLNDSMTGQTASAAKKLFVYNPSVTPVATSRGDAEGDFLESEYALMTEADVDREFEYSRYIALREEVNEFKKLTNLDAKRRALYEFWKKRDPDPGTKLNERKQDYLARVEYANLNFKTTGKEGWKTDRGRVYIVYGQPDETERHPNEIDTKPYEIWYYHSLQGGVEFVFIDKSSFSDYILVHSTHRNEIRDDNWRDQLVK